ncbi:TonB family protein [Lysobacter enzymogenes]|nr:TonB family protein [Lysobacter enzymogenes]QCW26162.1 TonB family protein [Lysobacter enzymogenes]
MRQGALALFAKASSLSLLCLCFTATAAQEKQSADEDGAPPPPVPVVVIEEPTPGAEMPAPPPTFTPATPRQAEQAPQFPGGEAALRAYLGNNLQYPAKAVQDEVQGAVVVDFDVDVDGTIQNILIVRDIGGGCGAEAERLVRKMPRWQPGRQGGEAVKATYRLNIHFVLTH